MKKLWIFVGMLVVLNASLVASHFWSGNATLGRWLFIMFIATLSDTAAAGLHALAVHVGSDIKENRYAVYQSWVLWSIALYELGIIAAYGFFPPKISGYTLGFSIIYWSVCYAKCYAIWIWALYKWGILNGHKKAAIRN